MGARSRRKGAAWEREVARRLEEAAGVRCVRNLDECRDGNTGDITTTLPLTVQAKVGGRPNPWQALREAVEAARPGEHPMAVVRMNGAGSRPAVDMACMPLDDMLELLGLLRAVGAW